MEETFILICTCISASLFAQTDSIFLHNEILTGEIKSIGATHLVYVPESKKVELTINVLSVDRIRFSDGDVMVLPQKTEILQLQSTEIKKPTIHFNPDELLGYQAISVEFFASRAFFFFVPLNRIKRRMYQKIENQAIVMNCDHVLIHTEKAVNWQPFTFKSANITAQFYNTKKPKLVDTTAIDALIQKPISKEVELIFFKLKNKIAYEHSISSVLKNVHVKGDDIYLELVTNFDWSDNQYGSIKTQLAKVLSFDSNSISLAVSNFSREFIRYDIHFKVD